MKTPFTLSNNFFELTQIIIIWHTIFFQFLKCGYSTQIVLITAVITNCTTPYHLLIFILK